MTRDGKMRLTWIVAAIGSVAVVYVIALLSAHG